MALSGGGQGVEFTSAFGGAAELHGRMASASYDANDPLAAPEQRRQLISGLDGADVQKRQCADS